VSKVFLTNFEHPMLIFNIYRHSMMYVIIFKVSFDTLTKIKNQFIKFAQVKADEKLLDFGCGTGTLLMMLATLYPNNELQGVDIDENVLKIAQNKIIKNDMYVHLKKINGTNLPYEDNYFSKILSSLVIHHISSENKLIIFEELIRVLKPGGEIFILDYGK